MTGIDPAWIGEFLAWYVVFVFSLTLHEGAHALLAYLGGDQTAYHGGQVTANPLPHMRREPFGTIFMPIISYVLAGWTVGWASTPYDPVWARRYPRRHALMSLAGPAANLLIALVALVALKALLAAGFYEAPERAGYDRVVVLAPEVATGSLLGPLGLVLSVALCLNLLLFLLNMVPLPPLDGASVVEGLAPEAAGGFYDRVRRGPMLGLLVAFGVIYLLSGPLLRLVLHLLHPGTGYT
jgi:Zn-dependent protease